MTDNTSIPYDKSFFERQQDGSLRSARIVLPIILDRFKPQSLIDVGCGVAGWASVAMDLDVRHVIGMDGDYVSRDQLKIPADRFVPIDLTDGELQADERFDLCISLEVAEHLPPERAPAFVRFLTTLADVVAFSAAIPSQGGIDHLNEQWQSYWVNLFNENGYGAQDLVRPKVWGARNVKHWYKQNCLVYVRGATNDKTIDEYDVVHPQLFAKKINNLKNRRQVKSPSPGAHACLPPEQANPDERTR